MMRFFEEHPNAPPFTDDCADLLDLKGLKRVNRFNQKIQSEPGGWLPGQRPAWLVDFLRHCFDEVPYYRAYDLLPEVDFQSIPTINRADLEKGAWYFVPDSLDLQDILVYRTSGATGHPIETIWHPAMCAMYLPLIQMALGWRGTAMGVGAESVAQVMVCYQKQTVTCPCISAYLDQAGFVKVNLHPDDWHHPEDRAAYLDACNPDTYSGDPISFAALMKLPLETRPKALISTSMALWPEFHRQLEDHFQCPVIDLYSLTETGPVAAGLPGRQRILPHHMFVEILDAQGQPLPPGEQGEITLTGGFNPYIPLLRYRTGDWGALAYVGGQPELVDLEGRPPVLFFNPAGQLVNNIDVTYALRPFALTRFTLHQDSKGDLLLRFAGSGVRAGRLVAALQKLFGEEQKVEAVPFSESDLADGKVIQYQSDVNAFDWLTGLD